MARNQIPVKFVLDTHVMGARLPPQEHRTAYQKGTTILSIDLRETGLGRQSEISNGWPPALTTQVSIDIFQMERLLALAMNESVL